MFCLIRDKFSVSYLLCITFNFWSIMVQTIETLPPSGPDFNTSGDICPMIFLFVYDSIHYLLIKHFFLKALWRAIYFTLAVLHVVCCMSNWQCGTHAYWVTGSDVLPHMVSNITLDFFVKIKNINMGQPTLHRLYPHMPPQTPMFLSLLRFTWFVMCIPPYTNPFILSDFNFGELPNIKC